MGVDTKLSLPPNVRVDDVADVIGVLRGREVELMALDQTSIVARVRGVEVKGSASIPQMCTIIIWLPSVVGEEAVADSSYFFHFECRGGRREMSARAMAANIALFKAVAEFFGGIVDYNDCDDEDADYIVPDKSDDENHPDDGEPWNSLQQRIAKVKPLKRSQIKACQALSAY